MKMNHAGVIINHIDKVPGPSKAKIQEQISYLGNLINLRLLNKTQNNKLRDRDFKRKSKRHKKEMNLIRLKKI